MSDQGTPTFRWAKAARRWIEVGGRAYVVGETHHRAKLTDADVELIFELAAHGLSQRAIARKFDDIEGGISRETVRDILSGRIRGAAPMADSPCRSR